MLFRKSCFSFGLAEIVAAGFVFAGTVASCSSGWSEPLTRTPIVSPTVTPTPGIERGDPAVMQGTNTKETPRPTGTPVSVGSSGTSESGPVRDMKPPANANTDAEPHEINKMNRVPMKTIDPTVTPSKDGALSPRPTSKKKPKRQKKTVRPKV